MLMLTLLFPGLLVAGETPSLREIWLQASISGAPAGYYHEKSEPEISGKLETLIESDVVINRLGSRVEIKSSSRYRESADGHLLSISSDMSSSMQSTRLDATVQDGSLLIHMTSGDKSYDRTVPFKGTIVGPEGARKLTLANLKVAGDTVSYQMFTPELGSVSTITRKLIAPEPLTIDGTGWPSLKLEESISDFPVKSTLWLDEQGRDLREVHETPFGEMAEIRSREDKVMASTVQGAALGDEAFTRTLVHSNIRLPQERLIDEVKLRLTLRQPEIGWPDLEADNQKVIEKTPNYVILEVRRPMATGAAQRPTKSSPELKPYLTPNALLQSDDANVQKIAREVVGNERDLFRSARALQQWTSDNMHFDAGIAIASASEVARDRRGTCFGYSTLLASLLRAAGIPSRVRMGFVYASGIWGGHAWVEILDGKTWIPLDGALYTPGPADAARFSVFTSSFEEGTVAQIGALARLFGNVNVEILEYTVDGKRAVVPQDAKPFVIDGDTYRNDWLGLTVTKPEAFRFTKLDSAWPDLAVVTMEGPQHEVVEIENLSASLPAGTESPEEAILGKSGIAGTKSETQVHGLHAQMISSPDKAAIAFVDGGNVWMVRAAGPKASDLLLKVASTLSLGPSPSHSQQGF
jgi:hypothetical protein